MNPHRRVTDRSWTGKVGAIQGFLEDGYSVDEFRVIVLSCPVISTDAIQLAIGKRQSTTRRPTASDRSHDTMARTIYGDAQ